MDRTEQRLKQDAALIRADVSPELRSRIDASLRSAAAVTKRSAREDFSFPLWLAASLTGVAAAVLIILLIDRNRMQPEMPAEEAVARSVPEYVRRFERQIPLQVETAQLTAPLEEELEDLQSDMEKARENVERDLDFTF